jgi:hypothetical protein
MVELKYITCSRFINCCKLIDYALQKGLISVVNHHNGHYQQNKKDAKIHHTIAFTAVIIVNRTVIAHNLE